MFYPDQLDGRFSVAHRWLCDTCLTIIDASEAIWVDGKPYCANCAQWKTPPILAASPASLSRAPRTREAHD